MAFVKATKRESKLRLALIGASGSGKTYSALAIATGLGGKIAVIDTERGSASKYADKFSFDVLELDSFSPERYVEAIGEAAKAGYQILVIDSLSHAWSGKDGALEMVDRAAKKSQSGNTYTAWRDVTPKHNEMVDAIVQAPMHIIATMRAKTEYVLETNERGKQVPRKVGLAPVQRDGMEYEFDVVATMDADNNMIVEKSRCEAMSGQVYSKPNGQVSEVLGRWLSGERPKAMSEEDRSAVSKLDALFNESIKGKSATSEQWAEAKPHWIEAGQSANQQAAKRGIKEIATSGYANPAAGIDALGKLISRLVAYDMQAA